MLGSLAICTVLYILMSSVLTGLVPFQTLNGAAPVAVALEAHPQLSWLSFWVILGALFGLTSVIITMIIPQARIWLTMSHDGLLPKVFGSVHPKYRTPHVSTLITGVAASLAAGLVPLGVLGELVSIGTLIAFIVVCIGVLVLRYTRPDLPRLSASKGMGRVVARRAVLLGDGLSLPNETWWRLLVWSAIGIFMYLVYGYRHSKLRGSAEAEGRDAAELTTGRR